MKLTSIALAMSAVTLSFSSFASLIITSQPDNASPTVSASGGNVPFDRSLQNSGSSALSLRVYDYLVFPDGSIYNRSNASNVSLSAGSSVNQTSTYVSVPSVFRYGTYQYVYAAYDKSSGEVSTSSFEFTKEPGPNDILQSCKAILDAGASVGDGSYHIDPDNDTATPAIEVFCDMTTDGGGWTLISKYSGQPSSCDYSTDTNCNLPALVNSNPTINAKLSNSTIYALVNDRTDAQFRAVSSSDDTVIERIDGGNPFDLIAAGDKYKCRDIDSTNWQSYTFLPNSSGAITRVSTWIASTKYIGRGDGVTQCGNGTIYSVATKDLNRNLRQWVDAGYTATASNPGVFYVR